MSDQQPPLRVMIDFDTVLKFVPVSRRTLFRMIDDGRFPAGMLVSGNRRAWYADEVAAWQNALDRKIRRTPRRRK